MEKFLKPINTILLLIITIAVSYIALKDKTNVHVSGGYLSEVDEINSINTIDEPIDINIYAINGHRDVFYNNYIHGDKDKYYRIPVINF